MDFFFSQIIDRNPVTFFSHRDVFPQGLPDEYAFVTTFKFRKTSRREDWYLWQVFDKYGIPQVGQPIVNVTFVCVCGCSWSLGDSGFG